MQHISSRLMARMAIIAALVILSAVVVNVTPRPAHAAGTGSTVGGLNVYVGYAEDKETNTPNPAAFPVPWQGAPNTTFIGGPVVGQVACHALPTCFDAGAIRLDNPGTTDVTVSDTFVDVHSAISGGKTFDLWGAYTVPAGKSVILTENPPNNNPSYDNFDTSGYPKNNCTPVTVAPTVKFTIGGVATTLVDSTHVLDTNGIDAGYCPPRQNESIQWRQIGTPGVSTATLTLNPTATTLPVGQSITATATLQDGGGNPIANANVAFNVTSGPNAGQAGTAVTNGSGNAAFTYADTAAGTDTIVASVTTMGAFPSNQASVTWGNPPPPPPPPTWTGADIGSPPLAGGDANNNGTWTISGSGSDIGSTSDQFHFVSQPLAGDGGIRAQVLTVGNTNSRAQAGVMLRQSSDPSAAFYMVTVTPQRGIFVLQRKTLAANVNTVTSIATGVVPVYLQVQRVGATFTAYTSTDGSTWTAIPGSSVTMGLTGTLLAGMAVSSHTLAKACTATFDAVSTP